MMTQEINTVKKCCLYASDFHLEMILLPYIKENLYKSKFIIITQKDLSDTIELLLDRVNITKKEKQDILQLSWKENINGDISNLKNEIVNNQNIELIINGESHYIKKINDELKMLGNDSINIIDCFDINDKIIDLNYIRNNYKDILNTSKM